MVIGCGGIGMNVVQGAHIAGARMVIADLNAANVEKVLVELRELGGRAEGIT